MGSVIAIPRSSANAKNADTIGGSELIPETIMKPSATVTSKIARLRNFWPPKRTDFVISPCSLPKAIKLPLKETAPMRPPTAAIVRCTRLCSLPPYSSTAAIAPAAPPPMPL